MTIYDVSQIVSIAVTCGGVFYTACLRPLNRAIEKLNIMLEAHARTLTDIQIKVESIDQRARSAHHRIDELVDELHSEIKYGGCNDKH